MTKRTMITKTTMATTRRIVMVLVATMGIGLEGAVSGNKEVAGKMDLSADVRCGLRCY